MKRFILTVLLVALILILAACNQAPVPKMPPPATSSARTYTEYEYNQIVKERDQLREELDSMKNGTNSQINPSIESSTPSLSTHAVPSLVDASEADFEYVINSGSVTINRYIGQAEDIIIPTQIQGFDVVIINGIKSKLVRTVIIPNGVTEISREAFSGCTKLESLEMPNSMTKIGHNAFEGCVMLKSIDIPDSVTDLGEYLFVDCASLTSVTIPDDVITYFSGFTGCTSLTNITIPNGVEWITGDHASLPGTFNNCTSLTSVYIPDSVTEIHRAFVNCTSLTNINIPDSVTRIYPDAFKGCKSLPKETMERIWQINPDASF